MLHRLFFGFLRSALALPFVVALLWLTSATGRAQDSTPPLKQPSPAGIPGLPTVPKPIMPGKETGPKPEGTELEAAMPPVAKPPPAELQPFGANLFTGSFLRARQDGLNPEYIIAPGDQVMVSTWGAVNLTQTLIVDGQGNVFLPEVGPIKLAGVKNMDLTDAVRKGLERVYARNFNVYTNLITAKPVAVFVTGGVVRPGRYAGVPSDSVLFFLDQAGGIDPKLGSYRKISILRGGKPLVEIDLYDFILKGALDNPQFKDGDTILVGQRGPVVELQSGVATPGLIEFKDGSLTGAEALAVIPGGARATEVTITGLRGGAPFSHTLTLRDFEKFKLAHGDAIMLRDDGRPDTILIKLEGEFQGPSQLAIRRGSRLIDVLNYVPVRQELANTAAVHLKRPSVAQAQKDAIDDSLFRLERSALLALSNSSGEANIRVQEAELTQRFVERAKLIQPLGRVVTTVGNQQQNIVLEEGDVVVIPARTNVVRVSGEVLMTQAVLYKPGLTAEDYIILSGGYTDRSERDRVIVLHPNAQVEIGDEDMPIRPGDEILVPPRVDSKEIQNVLDVTQIIYQIAVSAAVVIAIL